MIAPDAQTLAALETQLRQLTAVLDRLGGARSTLVPSQATFWGGEARGAYDRWIADLGSSLDETLQVVELARQGTLRALAEEARRG